MSTYYAWVMLSKISHLISTQAILVPSLPSHNNGICLDVLYSDPDYDGYVAQFLRGKLYKAITVKFFWMFTLQVSTAFNDYFLMVLHPFP